MEVGRVESCTNRLIPENEWTRSGQKKSGINAEIDETILKVTGLNFPVPDPEVEERASRRRFSAAYKRKILRQADNCTKRGELGALLRREGLYHSHIQAWRKARSQRELDALTEKKRGRKSKPKNPLTKEVVQLKRENARLKVDLRKAKIIIDVQKKISDLLGIEQPPNDLEKIE